MYVSGVVLQDLYTWEGLARHFGHEDAYTSHQYGSLSLEHTKSHEKA